MKPETPLRDAIKNDLCHGETRVFRNTIVEGWLSKFKTPGSWYVASGFPEGSADLLGCTTIIVTPEMVGKPIAVPVSCEVKTPYGKTAKKRQVTQRWWREQAHRMGCIAFQATSIEDARRQLKEAVERIRQGLR